MAETNGAATNGAGGRRRWPLLVGGAAVGLTGLLAARRYSHPTSEPGVNGRPPAVTKDGKRIAPGPPGNILLGSLPEIGSDNIGLFMDSWRKYGDLVRFRGPLEIYLPVHPDYIKHVLQDNHRNYPRPEFVDNTLKGVVGDGLVAAEGEEWRRSRRLAQPAFHRQTIATFGEMIADTTAEMLEKWDDHERQGRTIDAKSEMMRLSLAILAKALFKTDWRRYGEIVEPAVTTVLDHTNRRLTSPIDPNRVPILPATRRFHEAIRTLDEITYPLIAERRRSDAPPTDLIGMLLAARDEETGQGMTDKQARDEVMGFLIAGHETVSCALTWAWYLLSKNPGSRARLRAEVVDALAGRTPTTADVAKLKYTSMVIDETLRLYPSIFVLMRSPLEDDEIGGYHIPKGTNIALCSYVTHRHPDFWENPEGFDPERFSPERSAGRHRMAYFPFAGGPRKCIGDSFALLEMQLVIAMVTQRFDLDLDAGRPVIPHPAFSLRPRDPLVMTLRRQAALVAAAD